MKRTLIFFLALTLTALACGGTAPTPTPLLSTPTMAPASPKGNRLLGIDVNPASDGNYDAAFQLAKQAGMEHVGLFLQWSVLETAPGVYDDTLLDITSAYYPSQGIKLDLTLAVVNTTRKEFPADLANEPFDDPAVIERFKQLLDHVLAKTATIELGPLNIGSEYDVLFGTDAKQWQQFQTFYEEIAAYVHSKRPDLKIAVEATFNALVNCSDSMR